jgi:hypothetical protein
LRESLKIPENYPKPPQNSYFQILRIAILHENGVFLTFQGSKTTKKSLKTLFQPFPNSPNIKRSSKPSFPDFDLHLVPMSALDHEFCHCVAQCGKMLKTRRINRKGNLGFVTRHIR